MIKVAFLDRDGVINREKHYVHKIASFEFLPGVIEALRKLCGLGYKIIIVTNQAGIGKQIFKESDYWELTNWYVGELKSEGIDILDIFFCPHYIDSKIKKYKKDCDCRKPRPGMFEQAFERYDIDREKSFMVGDKLSDLHAAKNAGISRRILVRTGHVISGSKIDLSCAIFDNLLDYTDTLS